MDDIWKMCDIGEVVDIEELLDIGKISDICNVMDKKKKLTSMLIKIMPETKRL